VVQLCRDLLPVEIRLEKTVFQDYFKEISYWQKISNKEGGSVIYVGG